MALDNEMSSTASVRVEPEIFCPEDILNEVTDLCSKDIDINNVIDLIENICVHNGWNLQEDRLSNLPELYEQFNVLVSEVIATLDENSSQYAKRAYLIVTRYILDFFNNMQKVAINTESLEV